MSKHGIDIKNDAIIHDKYKMLTHVATGGMSEVYLVEEVEHPGRTWALKVADTQDKLAQKLVDETKILSELKHANLPTIVDFFQEDDYFYLVMEYAQGPVLSDHFEENGHQLPLEVVTDIGIQICDCLNYLHNLDEPIIYRDIKPGNIILRPGGQIMLIDFGIARKFSADKLKDTVRIGTVGFAAPEQFEKKQTDARTDLFSLGALLFYLVSGGKYVYTAGKEKDKSMRYLPRALKKCIRNLAELAPEDRLQTAEEARMSLEKANESLDETSAGSGLLVTSLTSLILVCLVAYGIYLLLR